MPKEINLKPDVEMKKYWRDNERFADLFNAVFFNGESVINAEELTEMQTNFYRESEKKTVFAQYLVLWFIIKINLGTDRKN